MLFKDKEMYNFSTTNHKRSLEVLVMLPLEQWTVVDDTGFAIL